MSSTQSTASAAAELGRLERPVIAGRRYVFRHHAADDEAEAGLRGLVAKVVFVDASGSEVAGDYPGCFRSERFGQFVYLATIPPSAVPSWTERVVEAPADAVGVRVSVYPWKASPSLCVKGPLQMRDADPSILFEHASAVFSAFPNQFQVGITDVEPSARAMVLQIRYFDETGSCLPGPYHGCFESEKFGQFVYVPTTGDDTSEMQLRLRAPVGAMSALFTGRRWKGTKSLALCSDPRVEYLVPRGVAEAACWRAIGEQGLELTVGVEPTPEGRLVVLDGQYFATGPSAGSVLQVDVQFLGPAGHPLLDESAAGEGLTSPVHELAMADEARPMSLLAWCPPGATTARLSVRSAGTGMTGALDSRLTVTATRSLSGQLSFEKRLAGGRWSELRNAAFAEWRLRLFFDGLMQVSGDAGGPDISLRFVDAAGRAIEMTGIDHRATSGDLRRTPTAIKITPREVPSGDPGMVRLRAEVQVLPPAEAAGVVVRISNRACAGELPFTCVIESCDALSESRIDSDSAALLLQVEEQSAEAARVMAKAVNEKHPDDPNVLAGLIDVYRRLGDATRMKALAQRALSLPSASSKLRYKARHILASLQEQDPHWQIRVPGDWSGTRIQRGPGQGLRVAHLFKTSVPHENTGGAIRCLNIVKFQKQIGMEPLVVTPLGYPRKNVTGAPWEREEVDGIPHFRLNGISREDLRSIPSTRQLEYTALLTANLLREQGVDLVQASSGYRGYEQALVGLAVARKLQVPFVYEVRSYHEHTWRPMADWILDAEFTRRRMAQEDRCMREADAVVTICETMKDGLIARGIPEEKIFVIPNSVDLAKFDSVEHDPTLRGRIGLSAKKTVGYISNISKREGHDILLRAVARARADGADIDCLIVGSGPELDNLRALSTQLGIEGSVVFTGEVPHGDIAQYYKLIDVFVIPRVSDFASDFVTPMKPFEAMAMGTPVVVADKPALVEIVGSDATRGLVFRSGDSRHLAIKIASLINDPGLAQGIVTRSYEWIAEERTWQRVVELYTRVYDSAMSASVKQKEVSS